MRIACLVTNDLSHDQRMYRICTTLSQAGHEVTLIGRQLPGSPDLPELPFRTRRLHCSRNSGKAFYAEFNYRLYRALRRSDHDVICAVDLDTLLAGYLLCRNGTRRLVFDAHEWFSETPEVVGRPLIRFAWQQLGRWLAPHADLRYTVGSSIAAQLARDYRCPFGVVRNLPVRAADESADKIEGVILYQGMLNPGRGLEALLRALAALPAAECWIIGDGPLRPALETLATRVGVRDRVWFAGHLPPAALPAFTAKAWVGVNLLSAASPSYYHSLANKALDYVQAGLPSVQMGFPEYRLLEQTYGCYALVDSLDPAALETALLRLLSDSAFHQTMADNCRLAAAALTWERESVHLLRLYGELSPRSGA